MSTKDYWIDLNGARHGPMNHATAQAAAAGLPEAQVWKEGWSAWKPVSEVFGVRATPTLSRDSMRALARTLISAGSWMQVCGAIIGLGTLMFAITLAEQSRSPVPAILTFIGGTGSVLGFLFSALLFKAGGEALSAFAQISEDVAAIRKRE